MVAWEEQMMAEREAIERAFNGWENMPNFLEGADIFQDVCEQFATPGGLDGLDDEITKLAYFLGSQKMVNAIRKDRGQGEGDGYTHFEINDDLLEARGPADLYLEHDFVVRGLEKLSERERFVVWFGMMEKWSNKELADELDVTLDTIVRDKRKAKQVFIDMKEELDNV